MTTTLRPCEAERRAADGSRGRRYAIVVNGRPVGEIEVEARERFGRLVGRLGGLRVDEGDRRRGRGTVALLAAEEVLRHWGCGRVEVSVAPSEAAGLSLARALGYSERSQTMALSLRDRPVPVLPPGCSADPLTDAEFAAWNDDQRRGYVEVLVAMGLDAEQAESKARDDQRRFLPEGVRTPGAVLRVLRSAGVRVGVLWLGLTGPDRTDQAWVYDVEVEPEHRGRGHGRTLMRLAEAECHRAGVAELGLNVFADNEPAARLYRSLGFQVTHHHLAKPLS